MAELNTRIRSYQDADKYLGSKESRPIAHNTRLERHDEAETPIAVRYHETIILQYFPDGRVILFSGGWRTSTTKDRLNAFLPDGWRVWQEKGIWRVYHYPDNSNYYIFGEGITLYPEGFVSGAGVDKTTENKVMLKRIKKYVSDYVAALIHGEIGFPDSGDCWGCLMESANGKDNPMGTDHLISHLDESYFVPSLLVRAIESYPVSIIVKHAIQIAWSNSALEIYEKDILTEQVSKSLTRYLKSRILGLGV